MKSEPLAVPGPVLLTPKRHEDERGYFVETYNQRIFAEAGIACAFVQDNQSLSVHKGTIRGLHFQSAPHAQAKLVRVLQGSVYDVIIDIRRGSPTYGRWCELRLSAEDGRQVFVPVGFAHGFCTLEPNTVVAYKVDGYYARDCEGGLRWDDPDLAIDWPVTAAEARLSDKDRELPPLREFSSPFAYSP